MSNFATYLKESFDINRKDALIKSARKVLQVSHDDLDGVGSVIAARYFLKNHNPGLKFSYDCLNYDYLYEYLRKFEGGGDRGAFKDFDIVLITDLNIKPNVLSAIFERNSNLVYIDHHQSTISSNIENCLIKDESFCAAKLTYNFFSKLFGTKNQKLAEFIDCVDAGDRYLKTDPKFEEALLISKLYQNKIYSEDEMIQRYSFDKESTFENYHLNAREQAILGKIAKKETDAINQIEPNKAITSNGMFTFYWAVLPVDSLPINQLMDNIHEKDKNADFAIVYKQNTFSMRVFDKCSINAGKFLNEICSYWNGHPKAAGGGYDQFPPTAKNKRVLVDIIQKKLENGLN